MIPNLYVPEIYMTDKFAQPDLVAIAQDTRLIGGQALPIQERAIDTAQIDQR